MAKITVSIETLGGELILPYEGAQQTRPTSIKIAFNKSGQVCIVNDTESKRFRFSNNDLIMENEVFERQRK
jgi:hypothetical protein